MKKFLLLIMLIGGGLEWSWKVNITNGIWILDSAMLKDMTNDQRQFPDSCSFGRCDSVPDSTNQEDLANYGYHAGGPKMRRITSQALWDTYINNPTGKLETERADYVKMVRRYKYRGNLW
jgi:hypothetical protein